jgi:hypothetical protein
VKGGREGSGEGRVSVFSALAAAAIIVTIVAAGAPAQGVDKPLFRVDDDCSQFAVAPDGKIVYAVPHRKHIKKLEFVHTDLWVAEPNGSKRRILDDDKFTPSPPAINFVVDSLSWSPDSKRIAAEIRTEEMSPDPDAPPNAIKAVALFDADGQQIRVAGTKNGFLEGGNSPMWLADGQTLVYLSAGPPYQILRMKPADGQATTLFEGHYFDAVAWDAARNQAFVISPDLSVTRRRFLIRLDLLHETIAEIARVDDFEGSMALSPSAQKVGFFADGDTIRVVDLKSPNKMIEVHAGLGKFQWAADERRVLLKRGPADRSGDLVWVGIYDDSFTPILHDLEFHDFQIEPNGKTLVVAQVGIRNLMVYPIE